MTVQIIILFDGKNAEAYQDFLVGPGQSPIRVSIATQPEDAKVTWNIRPIGNHSGEILQPSGSDKTFPITIQFTTPRPTDGSRSPNKPIGYEISVNASHPTAGNGSTTQLIEQNERATLRQEYVDFGLSVPPLERVVPASKTTHFTAAEYAKGSNYARYIVDGNVDEIVEQTRTVYGRSILLANGYRNPRRNKAVGGSAKSIHMSGGAADLTPILAENTSEDIRFRVALYRAALQVNPGYVLLEKSAKPLLPANWWPPAAIHTFQVGNAKITVSDSDNDDLPDMVTSIENPPNEGIPIDISLAYSGGIAKGPTIKIRSRNGQKQIQIGDTLVLHYPAGTSHPLADYFKESDHTHADNRLQISTQTSQTPVSIRKDTINKDEASAKIRFTNLNRIVENVLEFTDSGEGNANKRNWIRWAFLYLMWYEGEYAKTRIQKTNDGIGVGRGFMQFEPGTVHDSIVNYIGKQNDMIAALATASGVTVTEMKAAFKAFSDHAEPPKNRWPSALEGDATKIETWLKEIDSFGILFMRFHFKRFREHRFPPKELANLAKNPQDIIYKQEHADHWATYWKKKFLGSDKETADQERIRKIRDFQQKAKHLDNVASNTAPEGADEKVDALNRLFHDKLRFSPDQFECKRDEFGNIEGKLKALLDQGKAIPFVVQPYESVDHFSTDQFAEPQYWSLQPKASEEPGAMESVSALSRLLNNTDLLKTIFPQTFIESLGLQFVNLDILLSEAFDTFSQIGFDFTVSQWKIVNGILSLSNLSVNLTIGNPFDDASRTIACGIDTDLQISQIILPVHATIDDSEQPIVIQQREGTYAQFTLGDLAKLLGKIGDLFKRLPGNIADKPVELSRFRIEIPAANHSDEDVIVDLGMEVSGGFNVPLPFPGRTPEIRFSLNHIDLGLNAPETEGWQLKIGTLLEFKNLPSIIASYLSPLPATLIANDDKVFVEIPGNLLPDIKVPFITKELTFDTDAFAVNFADLDNLSLEAMLTLDTKPLNSITNIFVNEGIDFRLLLEMIDDSPKFALQMLNWPFKLGTVRIDEKRFADVDMGDWGAIKVQMPEIAYTVDGNFDAIGSIEVIRDLQLPLNFLHKLLKESALSFLAPDRKGIPLFPQVNLKRLLEDAGTNMNQIPDAIRPFLTIQYQNLAFNYVIGSGIAGDVQLGITAREVDQEIRLIAPAPEFSGAKPWPVGILLKRAKLRELAGLLFLDIDIEFELFNLVLIAARSRIPDDLWKIGNWHLLPPAKDIHLKFGAHNTLVLLSTGIPIPIFFNPIEFEYVGIEGLRVKLSWKFGPKNGFNYGELVQAFAKLYRFITEPSYQLKESDIDDLNLVLDFEPLISITLPFFNIPLTLDHDPINLGSHLVHVLNFVKKPDLKELLLAIPEKDREDYHQLDLGPIRIAQANWFIRSPAEIKQSLPKGLPNHALSVIDFEGADYKDDNIVVFLSGEGSVGIASLATTIGLVTTGKDFFALGIRSEATLGIDSASFGMMLQGQALLDTKTPAYLIGGKCAITIFNQEIFNFEFEINENHIRFKGKIDFKIAPLKSGFEVFAEGQLNSAGFFFLKASMQLNFFGLSITNATLTLSNRNVDENTPAGLQIRSEWLGIFALKFHAIEKQNTFALGGTTDIKEIELPAIIIPKVVEPNTHIQLLPEIKLDAGLKAKVGISIEMGDRPQFFSAGVAITFSWHKFNLNLNLTTDEAFASLERLIQFIAEEISKGLRNVYKAFSTIFEDIGRWLAAAAKWVDNAWKKLGDLINRAGEAGEEFLNNMVKWNEDFLNFTVNMAERAWDSIERFAGRAGEFIGETFEKVFGGLSKIGSAIGLGAIGGGLSVNFSPPFGYKAPGLALINQELHFDGWRLDSCWMALKKWPREAIDVLVYFGKNDDKAEEYKAFWETTVLFEDHHWNTSTEYTIDDWEALGKLPVFAWEAIRKTVRFPGRGFGIADAWKIMVGKWVSLAKWLDQTAWQAVMRFRDFVWEAVARFSAEDWLATSELPTIAWQNISDSLDPSNADSIGWNMPEAWQTTIGQWQNLQQLSNPKAWQTTIRFRSFIWNLLPALHTGDDGNDWKAISRLKDFVWDALFENLAPDHSANGWNLQAAWQATIGKWQYVETWSQHGIMQSTTWNAERWQTIQTLAPATLSEMATWTEEQWNLFSSAGTIPA